MDNEDILEEMGGSTYYSITLSTMLRKKLDQHLKILSYLKEQNSSRRSWIINAIQEKLNREKTLDAAKPKFLSITMDKETSKIIEEHLAEIAKSHSNYSKKQWLIDAIEEKLEAEKNTVQTALVKLKDEINR